jgi:hypothetical protein
VGYPAPGVRARQRCRTEGLARNRGVSESLRGAALSSRHLSPKPAGRAARYSWRRLLGSDLRAGGHVLRTNRRILEPPDRRTTACSGCGCFAGKNSMKRNDARFAGRRYNCWEGSKSEPFNLLPLSDCDFAVHIFFANCAVAPCTKSCNSLLHNWHPCPSPDLAAASCTFAEPAPVERIYHSGR